MANWNRNTVHLKNAAGLEREVAEIPDLWGIASAISQLPELGSIPGADAAELILKVWHQAHDLKDAITKQDKAEVIRIDRPELSLAVDGTYKVCPDCGSFKVDEFVAGWEDANTGEQGEMALAECYSELYYCNDCDEAKSRLDEITSERKPEGMSVAEWLAGGAS